MITNARIICMKLIVIYGLPASGKLTVAKELNKITGYPVVHNHQLLNIAHSLYGEHSPKLFDFYKRLLCYLLEESLRIDKNIIHTLVFLEYFNEDTMLEIEAEWSKRGLEINYVELRCDEKELLHRVTSEDRIQNGKIVNPEKLKKSIENKYVYLPNWSKEVLKIDNTNYSAKEVATLIKEYYSL